MSVQVWDSGSLSVVSRAATHQRELLWVIHSEQAAAVLEEVQAERAEVLARPLMQPVESPKRVVGAAEPPAEQRPAAGRMRPVPVEQNLLVLRPPQVQQERPMNYSRRRLTHPWSSWRYEIGS